MGKINGLHHVAIATGNMKEQLQFFSDVLGMRLQGLYWMHGVEGAWHALWKWARRNLPLPLCRAMKKLILNTGVTHAGSGAGNSAPGSMQHIALNVDTPEDLLPCVTVFARAG